MEEKMEITEQKHDYNLEESWNHRLTYRLLHTDDPDTHINKKLLYIGCLLCVVFLIINTLQCVDIYNYAIVKALAPLLSWKACFDMYCGVKTYKECKKDLFQREPISKGMFYFWGVLLLFTILLCIGEGFYLYVMQ